MSGRPPRAGVAVSALPVTLIDPRSQLDGKVEIGPARPVRGYTATRSRIRRPIQEGDCRLPIPSRHALEHRFDFWWSASRWLCSVQPRHTPRGTAG
jgi:hypothetical protein